MLIPSLGPARAVAGVCNPFPPRASQECLRLKEAYASLVSERRAKKTQHATMSGTVEREEHRQLPHNCFKVCVCVLLVLKMIHFCTRVEKE